MGGIETFLALLAVVVLIAGNGVFVAAEFSLVTIDRARVEQLAEAGDPSARRVLAALRRLSFQLSGSQLGITLTTLLVGFLAEPALAGLFRPALDAIPRVPAGVAEAIGVPLALLVATALQMVYGELVPKNAAIANPFATARFAMPVQRGFSAVFRPVIAACNGAANAIIRAFGLEPAEELSGARTADELRYLVRHSARAGTLEPEVAVIVHRALRFGNKTAGEVMVPRPDLVSLPAGAVVADLLEAARTSGHTRFPLVAADTDTVVGLASVVDAFAVPTARRATTPLAEIRREAALVPESADLDTVLDLMQESRAEFTVVIDEWGGTAGVITTEDLAEELVGDLADEFDPAEAAGPLLSHQHTRRHSQELPGLLNADAVEERTGFRMPEGPYDTLAGLVLARLGHLPAVGEQVEVGDWSLTVTGMDRHRIATVRVTPPPDGGGAS
jgi:CBS domain containing-hemolysin-like protein